MMRANASDWRNVSRRKLPKLLLPVFLMVLLLFLAGESICTFADDAVPDNGIPVIYVRVSETGGNPTIQDMLESPDHSVTCTGTLDIVVPEGFHYVDFPDAECKSLNNLTMSIRGRGNSTWERADKKPFKIKLDNKADVFGLGANKHWVLLANNFDPTLIKDRMTGWLGDRIGFEFTPRGVPVDLVMTGDVYGTHYLGSYYFSEQVRVGENRLEIKELKERDTNPETITGGYLLQESSQHKKNSPDVFYTEHGANWATHTPSFDTNEDGYSNPAQQQYIRNHIQKIEDALFAEDHRNTDGTDYRDLMDMESAARYWLINEVSKNSDAYQTGSTYIYKDRDVNGQVSKLFWGPLWDYDFAWHSAVEADGFIGKSVWINAMLYDREENGFVQEVYKQWPAVRAALDEMTKDGGLIDQYYEETKASEAANRAIWPPSESTGTYKEEIDKLKDWIKRRSEWIDSNIHNLDYLMHRIKFVYDGEVYEEYFSRDGMAINIPERKPVKEGHVFLGWLDDEGNLIDSGTRTCSDMVCTPKFISDEEATHAEDIAFKLAGDVRKYNANAHQYYLNYEAIPESAQDKEVEWSVSEPDFARIVRYTYGDCVDYDDPGDTPHTIIITGKLKSGRTREFALLVTNGDEPYPVSIRPEKEIITLNTGDQSACTVITEPLPASVNSVTYAVEDETVVSVDSVCGVITATAAGSTKIKITATSGEWNDPVINETEVKVIVRDSPDPQPSPAPDPSPSEKISGKIDNLPEPENITLDNREAVIEAMDEYNALSAEEKSKLEPEAVDKLNRAYDKIQALAVESAIQSLPAAITADDEAAVNDAVEACLALTDSQKAMVAPELLDRLAAADDAVSQAKAGKRRTELSSAKNLKGKNVQIKWKKAADVSGYQIRYSTSKKFKKNVKTKKAGAASVKLTLKKLKKGKTYYIRIRPYSKVRNRITGEIRMVYGQMSGVKKITVDKK